MRKMKKNMHSLDVRTSREMYVNLRGKMMMSCVFVLLQFQLKPAISLRCFDGTGRQRFPTLPANYSDMALTYMGCHNMRQLRLFKNV